MLASLNREDFITLLNELGQEGDDEVLAAARDLHARITVSGLDWDSLLVPEEDPDAEPEDDDEDDYADEEDESGENDADDDAEDDSEEDTAADEDEDVDADDADEDEDVDAADADEDEDVDAADADEDEDEDAKLSAEQKKEAADLIATISGLQVSASTKEDMKEYKQDLADGEFGTMDLNYLRSLRARLGK
jgi:hypothetical protein